MDAGSGWIFRTRTERDAELFLEELEQRRGRRPPRRQPFIALLSLTIVLVAWGLWSLATR